MGGVPVSDTSSRQRLGDEPICQRWPPATLTKIALGCQGLLRGTLTPELTVSLEALFTLQLRRTGAPAASDTEGLPTMGVGPERVACCRVARFGVDHVAAGAGVGGGRATGSLGSLPCRSGTAAIGQRPNRYQGGIRARNALTPEPGPMHFDFVTTSGPSSDFGRWPVTVTRCDGTNSTPTPGATSKRAEPTHRMRRRGVDE
jgi:hypothetical protein